VNWKGFLTRILLVAITFPVFIIVILLLPQYSHLGFNLLVVLAAEIGAVETALLFKARGIPTSTVLAPILGASLPAGTYLEIIGILPAYWIGLWIPAAIGIILVRAVLFQDKEHLQNALQYSSSSLFSLVYPGFLLTWIVRISTLPDPSLCILYFLCLVFGNDMSAYFAGSLWGASTRLNMPVSPQKSVVGFIAGLAGSLIIVGLFYLFAPGFPPHGVGFNVALGLCCGATAIIGDLLESGLKRSAGVKDSGFVILGRGGILDSVDSMVLTAPLFYYFFSLAAG
jgi:phosphatidate cytidylyltransferase